MPDTPEERRRLVDPTNKRISVRRQCSLLDVNRSALYYRLRPESAENLRLMRLIDEQYTKTPFYGRLRMTAYLRSPGETVNHKRVRRLMEVMGLRAIYPNPGATVRDPGNKVYPYLLRGLSVTHPNQVWSSDITYIPMSRGFMYLTAVLDWYSRYVISWELSNTLDADFCLEALRRALSTGCPDIFNTDQGAQFTAQRFTSAVEKAGARMSMDGRGRALDNVFAERLWRSVKYEDIYLREYETGHALQEGLERYFNFYNNERPHQSLGYRPPTAVHFERR